MLSVVSPLVAHFAGGGDVRTTIVAVVLFCHEVLGCALHELGLRD